MFPQKFLADKGLEKRDINVLANICFLTRSDNNAIKASNPADYIEIMSDQSREQYLNEAFTSTEMMKEDYNTFLKDRAKKLTDRAEELMKEN